MAYFSSLNIESVASYCFWLKKWTITFMIWYQSPIWFIMKCVVDIAYTRHVSLSLTVFLRCVKWNQHYVGKSRQENSTSLSLTYHPSDNELQKVLLMVNIDVIAIAFCSFRLYRLQILVVMIIGNYGGIWEIVQSKIFVLVSYPLLK